MGLLIDGTWHDQWYDTDASGGEFRRESAQFRNWITTDGQPGPTGSGGFPAEANRYHLYVSLACPWAHRTLIFRELKGLTKLISASCVHPHMLENGWEYRPCDAWEKPDYPCSDPINHYRYHHQLYTHAEPHYTGRATVPVLWDKKRSCIVSNESADIIRMLNGAFDHLTGNHLDFYPEALREQIDATNQLVYAAINNGVYRCGFATTQAAYEKAFLDLFQALDTLEARLGTLRYLTGPRLTEADWRLFTTLIRFDPVYYGHFKTNRQRLSDYPNLSGYTRELLQYPGVRTTLALDHIQQHYYFSHRTINPTGIVPLGPYQDWLTPHLRDHLPAEAHRR